MFLLDPVTIVILIFVILIFVSLKKIEKRVEKEGYYYNPHRICLQDGEDYPSYVADQYGKTGEDWPYKKKIDEYNQQPTQCGGCWATPSPVSMFKPKSSG